MARKNFEGSGTLPGMDGNARPRVRSGSPSRGAKSGAEFPTMKLVTIVGTLTVFLLGLLYAAHRTEQFLIRDERFALNGMEPAPTLEITGVSHTSRRTIESVFNQDSGRSIYLMPLDGRRQTLRTVDWVRDASIARLWPNRVLVRVVERTPVAFLAVDSSKFALIDEDGVVLPPAPDRFKLPVLSGVRPSDPIADRRDRVHRMLRMTRELGGKTADVSEIDVSDRDNLTVTQPFEGRVVTLMLGDHDYALRYQNFIRNYPEIKRRLPDAVKLDMRLEDRITVVE
jgi:cell division protein FtsQ